MALPTSRNTTYIATTSEVKAADLNDIQDKIVDENTRAIRPKNHTPADGFVEAGVTAASVDGFEGSVGSVTGGSSFYYVPLDLREGDILASVDVFCVEAGTAGEEVTLQLFEDVNGTSQQIGDTIVSGVTGAAATHTWDDTTNDSVNEMPYTVPTNGRLILSISFATTTTLEEAKVLNVRTVTS